MFVDLPLGLKKERYQTHFCLQSRTKHKCRIFSIFYSKINIQYGKAIETVGGRWISARKNCEWSWHKQTDELFARNPFCFPNGLENYLSSSCSKLVDPSMILACTDEHGVTRLAVVLTINEKLPANIANSSIMMLYDFKHICDFSYRFSRWWHAILVERKSHGKFSRFITKMSPPSSCNRNPAPTSTECKRRNYKFGTTSFGTPSLKRGNSGPESTVTESKITLEEPIIMFENLDQVSASTSMT